ncbi:hypothetical protein CEP54_010853 [Fusarium duplospermum]|uniref:Uncharacterized protein n=1 Tax=Fusarium duplospermum TaxID=1325734 RepID=A0A428PHM6_9HYPO|nr:hypothetical protein CEP54_010853 [Fusarium duplospermum]
MTEENKSSLHQGHDGQAVNSETTLGSSDAINPVIPTPQQTQAENPSDEPDIVELLLSKGANSQVSDGDGWTPVILATERRRLGTVEALLNHNPANINAGDKHGETPLHFATAKGYVEIMDLLLERGADIDKPDNDGETPLHCASRRGNDVSATFLLQKQANVDKTDDKGETPLYKAARRGHTEVIEALLEGNPAINLTDNDGKTALCAASQKAHVECVGRLCEAGADCNLQANEKEGYKTALYYVLDPSESGDEISDPVKENQHTIVVKLLAHGADPSIRNDKGDTALHHAAKVGHMGAYKDILEVMKDGKKRLINNEGYTALGLALESHPDEILELMIDSETADMFDAEDEVEALLWAAKDKENHHHAEKLFEERKHLRDKTPPGDSNNWSAIEWATYLEMPSVLDMLEDSQSTMANLERPTCGTEQEEFLKHWGSKTAVIECRIGYEKLTLSTEFRNVQDVIYGDGPVATTTATEEERDGYDFFTWVHLPATNMTWMNDLLNRILIEEPSCLNELRTVEDLDTMSRKVSGTNAFFESSWSQIPDKTSESRIMEPLYMNEPTPGITYYEHYLHAAYPQNDGRDQEPVELQGAYDAYHGLMKCYEGNVIHGSATLGESFYGFPKSDARDHATQQEDRQQKSENQVVTKAIHPEGVAERSSWTLVRVNQLWVWVIGHKWLITATTHPIDQVEDPLLTDLLDHVEKQAGVRSPQDIARAVATYCIDSYDRPPKSTVYETDHSIHQIFSDSIKKIARKDVDLFEELCQHIEAKQPKEEETRTMAAARLLTKIRSIHDELQMLVEIGKHQRRVWKKLMDGPMVDKRRLKAHVLNDAEGLIASANRIKSSVEMTLSLAQSQIANSRAEERVRQGEVANQQARHSFQQGRTTMIFTGIIAFFLSSSSLLSLSGMDIDSFGKVPSWAFLLACLAMTALLCSRRLGEAHRGTAVGGSAKEEADGPKDKGRKQLETKGSFRSEKEDWRMLRDGRVTWRRRQRENPSQV